MSDTNLHQQKKELIKLLNFWWHNPLVTDDKREQVLSRLEECLKLLQSED